MKRLKDFISVLLSALLLGFLVHIIVKISVGISSNLAMVCIVGIAIIGAWIVAED
jgi:membrane protein CcdC involved in cytochrome C biogenesis